jgi:uncharacterized membrane protein YvbJ
MRICPHCDSAIPEDQKTCPSCGEHYWNSDSSAQEAGIEEEEENEGCLSIFAIQFLVALAAFALLLFAGFLINLLVHFEQNQIKAIWIGAALLLATAISGIIAKLRQQREKGKRNQK